MSESGNNEIISISGDCSIYEIGDRFTEIDLSVFSTEVSSIEVDLENISDFDASLIQMLVLLKRKATKCGKLLRFMRVPDSVMESVRALYLVEYLDM